jgi:hypothetical protein
MLPGIKTGGCSIMPWPCDNRASLDAFYSSHELGEGGIPTAGWEARNLVTITAPFALALAWDPRREVNTILCHRRVAESLSRALQSVLLACGGERSARARA